MRGTFELRFDDPKDDDGNIIKIPLSVRFDHAREVCPDIDHMTATIHEDHVIIKGVIFNYEL